MDPIDLAFLAVVLIAFAGFSVAVAYANWITGGDKRRR
jgi:hypothetical protein